jgi:hypothetical protein
MRKSIIASAIAVTLASGLSFAAADKDGRIQPEGGMMSGDTRMEMMGDMHGMMKECREMMQTTKASNLENGDNPSEA